MTGMHLFSHAGNIFEQQKVNDRLTILLVSLFLLYYLFLGYLIDLFVFKNDPFDFIYAHHAGFPYGMVGALTLAGAYTIYCLYRGGDLILKSIRCDEVWGDDPEEQIVKRIWHDDVNYRQVVNAVTEMSIAAGVPVPSIYLVRDADPNAFVTGPNPRNAAIVLTTGLVQKLDREELQAVIAHEMAHIRNYDIRLLTLVATIVMGSVLLWGVFFLGGAGVRWIGKLGFPQLVVFCGGAVFLFTLWIGMTLFTSVIAKIFELLISDERVYQADVTAAQLTRNPSGLLRALKEIDSYVGSTHSFSPATRHLCVVGPGGEYQAMDNAGFGFRLCLNAHPPMAKRIEAIKELGFLQGMAPAGGT